MDYSEYSQWYRLTTGGRYVGFVSANPIHFTAARVGWSGRSAVQALHTAYGRRCVSPTMAFGCCVLHQPWLRCCTRVGRATYRSAVPKSCRCIVGARVAQCRDVHERFAVTAARVYRTGLRPSSLNASARQSNRHSRQAPKTAETSAWLRQPNCAPDEPDATNRPSGDAATLQECEVARIGGIVIEFGRFGSRGSETELLSTLGLTRGGPVDKAQVTSKVLGLHACTLSERDCAARSAASATWYRFGLDCCR